MMQPLQNTLPQDTFKQLFLRSKQLLSWTRRKIEIVETYMVRGKESQSLPYVSAGDIYNADLGINIGSEIDKERPVLIFQTDDRFVRQSNMAVVIPISSNLKRCPYRILISPEDIIENQGLGNSSILVQQIRSISKARLSRLFGRLSESKLDEVARELNKLLYKSTPLREEGDAQTIITDAAKD